MASRGARLALLALAAGLLPLPVAARQAPPQASLQWYQHYEKGLDRAAAGEWSAALADFEAAARTRHDPASRVRTYGARFLYDYDPLYQQARCLAELGRLEESRGLLDEAKAAGVTSAAALEALTEHLDALTRRREREAEATAPSASPAAAATPVPEAPPDAILAVRSSPSGARVRVDGQNVGTTPVDGVEVSPGRHRVELRLAGHTPWTEEAETRSGERLQLDVTLGEAEPATGAAEQATPARAETVTKPAAEPEPEVASPAPPPATPEPQASDRGTSTEGPAPATTAEGAAAPPEASRSTLPGPATSTAAAPRTAPREPSTALLATAVVAGIVVLAVVALALLRRRRGAPLRAATLPGRIGRYRVTGELGRGGMATTYRAERARDGMAVAIKIPHETGDPTYLPRFLREGRLGETLHHPRIVRIVEAGEEAGRPFLAMELIPGRTVRQALEEAGGTFPLRRALEVARDVAEAVDYAHGKGVVHRDLKPENVMVLPDGTVKVMDFGVARVEGQPGLTTSSFFFGSPVYAAPELVDPVSIDHRADLYSLGVVLFELLQGRPPFQHESVFHLIEMHQKEPLPEPETLEHLLPDEVWRVLTRLLAKSPADRYAGAQELLVDLERLLYELPGDAARDDGSRSHSRHLRHSPLGS